jgi:hypothetical protein
MKAIGVLIILLERFFAWLKQKEVDSAIEELKKSETEDERKNAAKSIATSISKR